ncbi:50S ribosomal protein L29 [Candidatus Woesebacteria bacterium RBG_16_34_12]|uniref:Large ribosomal subunit protein uL29 n=1 Tax=Candidatus Woesebacteria bacterium RBG_16_34_12 TaxID=1802480 RepID=A0A1F7X994_9BACT|nr:MAG: 50S ribosomal protein L29 [Candidatus Woesebacteria bacterium RBG_16_34_12]
MKKQDILELRKKSKLELWKEVEKKRINMAKFRARFKAGKEKNSQTIKGYKKDISRTLTIIKEKDILEKESEKDKSEDNMKKK